MSPIIVDKDKRKKEIAIAALDTFMKKGFEKTSINDIAHSAGIAKGSVYDYFESKNDLILYAVKTGIEIIKQKGEKESRGIGDPAERFRTFIRSLMKFWVKDKQLVKLTIALFHMMLSGQLPMRQKKMIFESSLESFGEIENILRDGIEKGVFRSELAKDAKSIAINIFAFLDGICLYYYIDAVHVDVIKQVDIYLETLIKGLKK